MTNLKESRRQLMLKKVGTPEEETRKNLEYLAAQGNTQQGIRAREELAKLNQPTEAAPIELPSPATETPSAEAQPIVAVAAVPIAAAAPALPTPSPVETDAPVLTPPPPAQPAAEKPASKAPSTPAAKAKPGRPKKALSTQQTEQPTEKLDRAAYLAGYRQERIAVMVHRPFNTLLRQISLALEDSPEVYLGALESQAGRRIGISDAAELAINHYADYLRSLGAALPPKNPSVF